MSRQDNQLSFLDKQSAAENTPVVCLGMKFESEEARREYFREELRKKLPELKNIEGFPIGEDEDIIALSDPPYYMACPNPWINDFIEEWEKEKLIKHSGKLLETYHRFPFSSDVTEGKNDAIYNAHSYHTKTPHKAIMRYILNYTDPGDIVFDGFSGTGMTGVASQLCGSVSEIEQLDYEVSENGTILDKLQENGSTENTIEFSKIGSRHAILMDISPAATLISQNYNAAIDSSKFEKESSRLLNDLKNNYEWMYSTLSENFDLNESGLLENIKDITTLEDLKDIYKRYEDKMGKINYIVWSEVHLCSNCSNEIIYYDAALNKETKRLEQVYKCPYCSAEVSKNKLDYSFDIKYDNLLGETIQIAKRLPVLINFTINKKRFNKKPDIFDLKLIKLLKDYNIPYKLPSNRMMYGGETRRNDSSGHTHVHHFYTDRTLLILGDFINQNNNSIQNLFLHGSVLPKLTKFNRFMPQHGSRALVGPMANTLYLPPVSIENNALSQLEFQQKKIIKAFSTYSGNIISTQSSSKTNIKDNSIDYIFLDPPFGANIMYSELNFIRESWINVITNSEKEAIENKSISKSLSDYQNLMTDCFREAYRILKSGRWITIEFSNTQAKIWNVIQRSLQEVGFVIASVDALNKKRGGLHSMIGTTAVKQDLVISAYKPSEKDIIKIREQTNTPDAAWTFISQHLEKLPIFLGSKGEASIIAERTPRILYDRMIAYHVQNNLPVPISSAEFQSGVIQSFPIRDGMIFLESQVAEYDKKRILVKEFSQLSLFISDENSAIEWLRQQLMKKPQTSQDLHPQFMKEIQHIAKHEQLPEMNALLLQSFLRYEGNEVVPDQIASYLRRNYHDLRGLENSATKMKNKALNRWYVPDPNKQADLEKLREKSLLREFDSYIEELLTHKKKLKQFRTEAIRAGFKKAWSDKDYTKIVTVGDRLPETVIQEDDKLLMYYDNAQIRLDM
ncbi:site-specific DNA-methyltransferase [Planococcus sp. ANT_H30]|uniref:DNA methyltransferase n=1 Tax=Planococcus sp. ANT_H30 TaxID=2597347 RepID=UPI0011EF971C|nr:DNA methyltransferase [Planococcus sp. ANT_H30]KAA0956133.1 site-specific DNA-methyltransferase [Planococcus sp. ANT_H30]